MLHGFGRTGILRNEETVQRLLHRIGSNGNDDIRGGLGTQPFQGGPFFRHLAAAVQRIQQSEAKPRRMGRPLDLIPVSPRSRDITPGRELQ